METTKTWAFLAGGAVVVSTINMIALSLRGPDRATSPVTIELAEIAQTGGEGDARFDVVLANRSTRPVNGDVTIRFDLKLMPVAPEDSPDALCSRGLVSSITEQLEVTASLRTEAESVDEHSAYCSGHPGEAPSVKLESRCRLEVRKAVSLVAGEKGFFRWRSALPVSVDVDDAEVSILSFEGRK